MDTSLSLLERLADRPAEGDWERLVALYQPLLRLWALRSGVADADADDLVQETLSVVVRQINHFRRERCGSFRSWLRAILMFRLREYLRRRARQPAVVG